MNTLMIITQVSIVLLAIIAVDLRWCICTTLNEVMYSFRYAVEAADVITHHFEERKGDIVRGSYSLLEPDGKIRIVEYQVDGPKGFRATVKHRQPAGNQIAGHLNFPNYYRHPIPLAKPVGLITSELLHGRKSYPNFSL